MRRSIVERLTFVSRSNAMRAWQPFITAMAAAILTLAAMETGARWLRSLDPVGHSYEVPRNPHFRRDWPRYTEPRPRTAGSRLIIVIGNSQGFFREESDGALAWPSRLQDRLDQDPDDVIVANWSIPAGNGSEMILLAARAASHQPDLVIVSAGANTFSSPRAFEKPISFWLSDATNLAYLPSVRSLLSADFLRRTQPWKVEQALRAWSALAWFRSRHLDRKRGTWTWIIQKYRRIRRLPIYGPSTEAAQVQLRELSSALLRGSPESRLLVVQMPLAPSALVPPDAGKGTATVSVASDLFRHHPRVRVADALKLFPDERFHTATHLDARGHEAYADWLAPIVRELLTSD